MKKLIVMFLVTIFICGLVGCGANNITDETASGTNQTQGEESKTVFDRFEQALSDKDITFEKIQMAADLVGAKQGVKYKIGNGSVELYSFDKSSETYRTAEDKQALTLEGFGDFSCVVTNGYALLVNDLESIVYEEIFDSVIKK